MAGLIDVTAWPVWPVLPELLRDKTTKQNIIWATDAYTELGNGYEDGDHILPELLSDRNKLVLRPRTDKSLSEQLSRTRKKAEVMTPVWLCNRMNNYADREWFGRENVFNRETGEHTWEEYPNPVDFGERGWQAYVDSRRLEITCGEAPFLVSRYDTTTGEPIPILHRVGMLDRKLRAVNENARTDEEWLKWSERALQSCYGYEYQGDNLLLARANVLLTWQENYNARFGENPEKKRLRHAANIIAWNLWQMDGLKDTVPPGKQEAGLRSVWELAEDSEDGEILANLFGEAEPRESRIFDWRKKNALFFSDCKERGVINMSKKLFDFVIGNPPYQEESVGDSNTATPVYHLFMDATNSVSDRTLLITPARFLFNAGYTPKEWNQKMLSDPHFCVLEYFPNSASVFSGVDIKGGVAISYRDESINYGAIEIFTQYPVLNKILHKVLNDDGYTALSSIIVSSFSYHFTPIVYDENPTLYGRASRGHDFDIQSNAFETFPELFFDDIPDEKTYIRILGRLNGKRCLKYIQKRYVSDVSNLDKYKVFFAKAAGTGHFGEILPEGIIGNPGEGNTVTYLSIGRFETTEMAENCSKYIRTKFARAMLGVLKVTQDITPAKWQYVPLQDFTAASDIDWSKSVADIDRQLYRKYDLSTEEIRFIEENVKEMA